MYLLCLQIPLKCAKELYKKCIHHANLWGTRNINSGHIGEKKNTFTIEQCRKYAHCQGKRKAIMYVRRKTKIYVYRCKNDILTQLREVRNKEVYVHR